MEDQRVGAARIFIVCAASLYCVLEINALRVDSTRRHTLCTLCSSFTCRYYWGHDHGIRNRMFIARRWIEGYCALDIVHLHVIEIAFKVMA